MPQRSAVIFWLLMAATICADVATIAWMASDSWGEGLTHAVNVCSALTLGQLSIIAVWLVFRPRHDLWSWFLPLGALLAASMIRARLRFFEGFTAADYALRSGLQMLVAIVVLWLLMRTPMWRRLSPSLATAKWEYSMRQLIFWMTATAAVSVFVARSTWTDGRPLAITQPIGIFAPAAVTVGVVILSQLKIRWPLRIAGYLIVGVMVGTGLAAFREWSGIYGFNSHFLIRLNLEFMIEALVIAAWTEWGGILLHSDASVAPAT